MEQRETGETISDLGPGTYIVTITATDQCTTIDTAVVTAPAPLMLDSVVVRPPDCPGFNNGQITVFPSGGTEPYRFICRLILADTTTLNPLPGLEAGLYQVTVVDANNCQPWVELVEVLDPPSIQVDLSALPRSAVQMMILVMV